MRDIYLLHNIFFYNLLDHVYVDFDYLKRKHEFYDDELFCSSDRNIENIKLVARAINIDECAKDLCNEVY